MCHEQSMVRGALQVEDPSTYPPTSVSDLLETHPMKALASDDPTGCLTVATHPGE